MQSSTSSNNLLGSTGATLSASATATHPDGWVRLCVGGKLFLTHKSTLLKQESTFFTGLLSGQIPSAVDASGAYLIDRNGRLFEPLLEYLRTGELHIRHAADENAVKVEAEFYGIKLKTQAESSSRTIIFIEFKRDAGLLRPILHTNITQVSPKLVTQYNSFFHALPRDAVGTYLPYGWSTVADLLELFKRHGWQNIRWS